MKIYNDIKDWSVGWIFFSKTRELLGKSFKEKIDWVKILIKGDSDLQMLNKIENKVQFWNYLISIRQLRLSRDSEGMRKSKWEKKKKKMKENNKRLETRSWCYAGNPTVSGKSIFVLFVCQMINQIWYDFVSTRNARQDFRFFSFRSIFIWKNRRWTFFPFFFTSYLSMIERAAFEITKMLNLC